jgi:hypothetical protein
MTESLHSSSSPQDPEMPVVKLYLEILHEEARTPEDVQTLIAMFDEDQAARAALLEETQKTAESLIALDDGTVVTAREVTRAIWRGCQAPGTYDGKGRRA